MPVSASTAGDDLAQTAAPPANTSAATAAPVPALEITPAALGARRELRTIHQDAERHFGKSLSAIDLFRP